MPNSSGKIMRNKLLTEKMRGQSIAMVSALVNANMVRLEEQADVWRQGAPDIKAVEIVVPQKLRAVTPDDSTEVQAMWLQEQVTGAAILEGIELGGAGKLVSKMSLGGEYPESVDSVEQPWRIQVGEELKCVRKFGHSWKTEAGHRKGAVEWNVGTYKLQVLAEVERQLIGVGASELARRLTEACGERRKHDGVLPFKENVLYEAKALGVDCAAMREIIELAEVGMFYGAQIRDAIRVLEIKAEVVAGGIYGMAEELKNGGHTQAADGVRAVGQSLGQWSKSKPSERVKMDQHMQYIELISELEGIVNQARIAEATFRGSVKRLPGVGEIRGILRNCRKWSGLARAYERELAGRKDTAARLRARLEEAERARAESS
jgi:hypothetical protein